MKKSLVALAALAATASFAQVTLSGRASMDVSTFETNNATSGDVFNYARRVRVADTSSRITFAANEDLGGGMRAGVYCETGINIDTANANGQANTANANTSEWCSREGRAYLGSGGYEIRLGRQNVWWTQGELNQVGSTFLGSDTFTNLQNGGVGVFGVRLENMVKVASTAGVFAGSEAYWGVMGNAQGEGANASFNGTLAAQAPKGKYHGFKLQYTQGAIVGMIDYQNSTASAAVTAAPGTTTANATLGANSFDRSAYKLGLGYKYNPNSIVAVQYWAKKRTDVTTAGATFVSPFLLSNASQTTAGDAKDSGYGIVVKHDLGGNWTAHAQWGKANKLQNSAGDVADSGATAYTLGLTKALSKRTHIYTAYHVINNQANAAYGMTGGNYSSAANQYQGADNKIMSLGMIHNF
jgi:predicted porin